MVTESHHLSANFQIQQHLKNSLPNIQLWEDTLPWENYQALHHEFKTFSVSWFKRNGIDVSHFDGCSLASAWSFFLYFDLESWVRATTVFSKLAQNRSSYQFHVPSPSYLPDGFAEHIDALNEYYGGQIKIVAHDLQDNRVESSLRNVLHASRALKPLKRHETMALDPHELPSSTHRCLTLGFRGAREHIKALADNPSLHDELHLVFDNNLSVTPWIAPPFTKPEIRQFASFVQVDPAELACDKEAIDMGQQLAAAMNESVMKAEFLPSPSREFLANIFASYARRVGEAQLRQYCYLREVITRFSIDRTLSNLHDDAETYYCKYLMDKVGGRAFFQPHGLIGKEQATAGIRKDIGHAHFFYSEGERRYWQALVPQSGPSLRIRHTPPSRPAQRSHGNKIPRILILADNFHCRLISKINYFQGQKALLDTLAELQLTETTIRLHGSFFNNFKELKIDEGTRQKYFNGFALDSMYDEPFAKAVEQYDLVIGPMSTCIYETISKGIPFVAYTPGYRPSESITKTAESIWIEGLQPLPAQDIAQLRDILMHYLDDPTELCEKQRRSIKTIDLAQEPEVHLWKSIASNAPLSV